MAFAQGGHRQYVQARGADQFDEQDPEECKTKSSFFNWWNFCYSVGSLITNFIVSYIQDNLSSVLGFNCCMENVFDPNIIYLNPFQMTRYYLP